MTGLALGIARQLLMVRVAICDRSTRIVKLLRAARRMLDLAGLQRREIPGLHARTHVYYSM
jgi:hypothetical protein